MSDRMSSCRMSASTTLDHDRAGDEPDSTPADTAEVPPPPAAARPNLRSWRREQTGIQRKRPRFSAGGTPRGMCDRGVAGREATWGV